MIRDGDACTMDNLSWNEFLFDVDPDSRARALEDIRKNRRKEARDSLLELFHVERDISLRIQIVNAVSALGDIRNPKFLRKVLCENSEDIAVRKAALAELFKYENDLSWIEALAAQNDMPAELRTDALGYLSESDYLRSIRPISVALLDPDDEVRSWALAKCSRYYLPAEIREALAAELVDPAVEIYPETIEGIGDVRDERFADRISEATRSMISGGEHLDPDRLVAIANSCDVAKDEVSSYLSENLRDPIESTEIHHIYCSLYMQLDEACLSVDEMMNRSTPAQVRTLWRGLSEFEGTWEDSAYDIIHGPCETLMACVSTDGLRAILENDGLGRLHESVCNELASRTSDVRALALAWRLNKRKRPYVPEEFARELIEVGDIAEVVQHVNRTPGPGYFGQEFDQYTLRCLAYGLGDASVLECYEQYVISNLLHSHSVKLADHPLLADTYERARHNLGIVDEVISERGIPRMRLLSEAVEWLRVCATRVGEDWLMQPDHLSQGTRLFMLALTDERTFKSKITPIIDGKMSEDMVTAAECLLHCEGKWCVEYLKKLAYRLGNNGSVVELYADVVGDKWDYRMDPRVPAIRGLAERAPCDAVEAIKELTSGGMEVTKTGKKLRELLFRIKCKEASEYIRELIYKEFEAEDEPRSEVLHQYFDMLVMRDYGCAMGMVNDPRYGPRLLAACEKFPFYRISPGEVVQQNGIDEILRYSDKTIDGSSRASLPEILLQSMHEAVQSRSANEVIDYAVKSRWWTLLKEVPRVVPVYPYESTSDQVLGMRYEYIRFEEGDVDWELLQDQYLRLGENDRCTFIESIRSYSCGPKMIRFFEWAYGRGGGEEKRAAAKRLAAIGQDPF